MRLPPLRHGVGSVAHPKERFQRERVFLHCHHQQAIPGDTLLLRQVTVQVNKKLQIHNSTAEFFIFQIENKEEGIEVLYQDESLWLTQDAIAVLFDKSRSTITEHLQNIFQSQELQEDSVCRKFRRTASDGKSYATKYYKFAIRGYVVDKKRFEKYRIIQDRLFQSDFDKYQTDNLLDFDNEIES